MTTRFGDRRSTRGQRGPPGPTGKSAFDLAAWCPNQILEIFRKSEALRYYFNTLTDGITPGVAIKNRTIKGVSNAVLLEGEFPKLSKTGSGKYYILELRDCIFKIDKFHTGITLNSSILYAISWKPLSNTSDDTFIFSNRRATRAISIRNRDAQGIVTIHSNAGGKMELLCDPKHWNYIIIQYAMNMHGHTEGSFMLNGKIGIFFPADITHEPADDVLYMGGNPESKIYTKKSAVSIGSFEVHRTFGASQILPDNITSLITADMEARCEGWDKANPGKER